MTRLKSTKEIIYKEYWWASTSPCGSAGKESTCNAGDWGSIPGLGRSPGDFLEKGKATQSSILA